MAVLVDMDKGGDCGGTGVVVEVEEGIERENEIKM